MTADRDARGAAGLLARKQISVGNIVSSGIEAMATVITDADEAAQRCGIREGETLAEFIRRLHDEANADED